MKMFVTSFTKQVPPVLLILSLLSGGVVYINYPVAFGKVLIDVRDHVEDLTPDMRRSLTEGEQNKILEEFKLGYEAFNEIQSLNHLRERLQSDTTDLLMRGIADIEKAASLITDTQNTIFHAHQASEKFLKALFVALEYQNIIKKYGTVDSALQSLHHRLLSIYNKLPPEKLPHKKVIHTQVKYLNNLMPSMDIRYK